jgi:hypothetical protein
MRKFSERLGFNETPRLLQTEGMSDELRNSLWNFIVSMFDNKSGEWQSAASWVAQFFRKVPVDDLPGYDKRCQEWIKTYFFGIEWYEVYDFIEFIAASYHNIVRFGPYNQGKIHLICNQLFERELSGYRFISGVLAPITNPAETAEISAAIDITSRTGLDGAHAHIHTALHLLSQRPTPDYRNSIKEAISAVESVAKVLGSENAQGLTGALTELSKKTNIHGALQSGFIKLYGYASDEDGIRHAILDESSVGFDEAKYMIVSCSAFVNYLIAKAEAAGLLKNQ